MGRTTTSADLLFRDVVRTNSSGAYEAHLKDKRVTRVIVRPLLCSYDPTDPKLACCVDLQNPCGACPEVWGRATSNSIAIGTALNGVNLTVVCTPSATADL